MDRKIVYPAQIPLVEDHLEQTRFIQKAFGFLAQALAGESGTFSTGLDCAPATGMTVTVAPGQIIAPGEVDSTSYGVLEEDTTSILTQYLLGDAVTLTVPGVGATYLIYATPSVADQSNLVLPFYNSANPTQVYAGPDNNGASSATVRASILTVSIGTSVPSGSTPLWQIVVPSTATAIAASMISAASGSPFYPSLAATAPRTIAPFNAELAAAFGGYPLNAIVSDATTAGTYWRSTAAGNTTVPGATDAKWVDLFSGFVSGTLNSVSANGDKDGTGLNYEGSTGNPLFSYDGGSGELAWYSSLTRVPTLYSSSTTLTVPSGVTIARIEIVGGGGSGCSVKGTGLTDSVYGAGGGAGGYLYFWIAVSAGDTIGLTVGAGAAAPTNTVDGQTNGGDTIITLNGTEIARASGGSGGIWSSASSSAGGAGGSVTAGTAANSIRYSSGTDGGDGQTGSESISSVSGYGGPGPWGGGGRAGNGGGYSGGGFGAGGGGAYDTSYSDTFYDGGAGHDGCAIVEFK